jgi:hypothetical protein
LVAGDLAALALLDLGADALGLVDRDEGVLDEEVGDAALVRIGRLLLLLATEVDLGLGGQARLNDDAADLGVEVR